MIAHPGGASLRLSVVIPLGPGETEEAGLLPQLAALPPGSEVVLVRSDPRPRPVPAAWPDTLPLRQIEAPPGRAVQLNAGAAVAQGAWLWFLHADTRLTAACLPALAAFIGADRPALGWFRLGFRDGPWPTRLNAAGANWRSRRLGLPFGDQGFVLPSRSFEALGRFDETAPYGEDHLLAWAAHGAGLELREIRAVLSTSARKYARRGWAATTWLHWRLTIAQAYRAWRNLRAERAR